MCANTIEFTGLGKTRKYNFNNTTYYVQSRFQPIQNNLTLKENLEKVLQHDFVDWTDLSENSKMTDEYIHSAVGKEEHEAEQ